MNKIFKYFNLLNSANRRAFTKCPNNVSKYYLMQYPRRLNQVYLPYIFIWKSQDYRSKLKNVVMLAAGCGVIIALCESNASKDEKLFFRSAQFGDVHAIKPYVYQNYLNIYS